MGQAWGLRSAGAVEVQQAGVVPPAQLIAGDASGELSSLPARNRSVHWHGQEEKYGKKQGG